MKYKKLNSSVSKYSIIKTTHIFPVYQIYICCPLFHACLAFVRSLTLQGTSRSSVWIIPDLFQI